MPRSLSRVLRPMGFQPIQPHNSAVPSKPFTGTTPGPVLCECKWAQTQWELHPFTSAEDLALQVTRTP